jgi:enoyl-CoA hydratase/carnithine racemase
MADNLHTQPPPTKYYLLSYPAPHVLLVTINREKQHNALNTQAHWEGDAVFRWFDREPSLRVAVITGNGTKAFCAGQDLIEQSNNVTVKASSQKSTVEQGLMLPAGGFMGVSRRRGKKPVIAAVNGYALGGGFEICLNWYEFLSFSDLFPQLPASQ